jgi:hypothetical protein
LIAALEGFELVANDKSVNEPIRESRSIYLMKIIDTRKIVELNIPGSFGNVLQDMGREPVVVLITGEFVGPDAKTSLENLMSKYNSERNKPMQFFSEMTMVIPEITKVLLDQFRFEEIAGYVNSYRYSMKLVEYREPRQPQVEKAPDQNAEMLDEIDDIRGQVLDNQGNPMAGVNVKVKGPNNESIVTTDEKGFYELLDVPEGRYEITVEDESFEGVIETIEVKKGDSKQSVKEE